MTSLRKLVVIEEIALKGLQTDGAHHKQWYLEQILKMCGWEDPEELQERCPHKEGIAP